MREYVFKKKSLVSLASALDAIGDIIFSPVKRSGQYDRSRVKKILLIRVDHIGDVISATGALKSAHETFPGAVIDFMVSPLAADIVRDDPRVTGVVPFEAAWFRRKKKSILDSPRDFLKMVRIMKRGKYDLAVDLRGDMRHIAAMFIAGVRYRAGYGITGGGFLLTHEVPYFGVMHEVDRNIEIFRTLGADRADTKIELYFPAEHRKALEKLKEEKGLTGKYAVIHPIPGHPSKVWSLEKFAETAAYLADAKKLVPVIVGSAGDTKYAERIFALSGGKTTDITGKTPFGVLYYLLKEASLFLGVDSGPAHIASAAGTPSVILFSGINDPDQWAPRGKNVHLVYPGRGNDLSGVGVEEVVKVIEGSLEKRAERQA